MSKKKNQKLTPVLISSREGMHAVVTELKADKIAHAALLVEIEEKKAAIDKKYQADVDKLTRSIQMLEGGLQVWSQQHRDTVEFDGKKSIDLPAAQFGFRLGSWKVSFAPGLTGPKVVARLISTVIRAEPEEGQEEGKVIFDGDDYLRYADPTVDKEALLGDRQMIPAAALKAAGIFFEQEEFFYFDPKSEVLEATSQEAA